MISKLIRFYENLLRSKMLVFPFIFVVDKNELTLSISSFELTKGPSSPFQCGVKNAAPLSCISHTISIKKVSSFFKKSSALQNKSRGSCCCGSFLCFLAKRCLLERILKFVTLHIFLLFCLTPFFE